jgi:hypothetical protein
MHCTFYEIANPPTAMYQIVYSMKFVSYLSLILSFTSDFVFKYIYEEDISIFNFTNYLIKIILIFCFILDILLALSHTNKSFSTRYFIYIFLNRFTKSFLYDISHTEYLLVMTIFPMTVMEALHNYVCISLNNVFVLKIRYFLYRALLFVELAGEVMLIYNMDHYSSLINFSS